LFCRIIQEIESNKKLGDIVLGNNDCNIVGHLARLWDSRNMRSHTTGSLISVDGLIVEKDVSVFYHVKCCYPIFYHSKIKLPIFSYKRELWFRLQFQKN
jgi:hypothetical protein